MGAGGWRGLPRGSAVSHLGVCAGSSPGVCGARGKSEGEGWLLSSFQEVTKSRAELAPERLGSSSTSKGSFNPEHRGGAGLEMQPGSFKKGFQELRLESNRGEEYRSSRFQSSNRFILPCSRGSGVEDVVQLGPASYQRIFVGEASPQGGGVQINLCRVSAAAGEAPEAPHVSPFDLFAHLSRTYRCACA